MRQLNPRTVHARRDEVQLLDVREHDEWNAGHIQGAVHIPMGHIPDRLGQVDRDQLVVTVCHSGRRSGRVAAYLERAGFTAANMTGGMQQWEAEGLPVVGPQRHPQ